jgi:histidine triad (HIT) family protein
MAEEKTPQQILEEQKANCPFCKIVKGDFPAKKVYEDDKILAVLDINPAVKGHTLVLPKEHYPIITMIPPDLSSYMFEKTGEIAKSLQESMVCKGVEIFIASGGAAGQQVPHFMLHIVPRDDGDGLSNFDLKTGMATEEQMKEISEKISQGMQQVMGKQIPEKITKEKLIQVVEQSPQLKEALVKKTEEFKKMVEATPQLKALFKDFDVDEIAAEMKGEKKKETAPEEAEKEETKKEKETKEVKEKEEPEEQEEEKTTEKEEKEEKTEQKEESKGEVDEVKDLLGGGKEAEEEKEEEEKEESEEEPDEQEEKEEESDDSDEEDKGGADLDLISKLF